MLSQYNQLFEKELYVQYKKLYMEDKYNYEYMNNK